MDKVTQQSHYRPASPARITRFAAMVCLAGLLSACSTASYPSLARRESETLRDPNAQSQPTPPPILDASAGKALAALLADARAAQLRFTATLPQTRAALDAASGHKAGDAPWSIANSALSELERARADLGAALSGVDHLYTQDRLAHPQADASPPLAEAQAALTAQTAAQDKILNDLRAKLP